MHTGARLAAANGCNEGRPVAVTVDGEQLDARDANHPNDHGKPAQTERPLEVLA